MINVIVIIVFNLLLMKKVDNELGIFHSQVSRCDTWIHFKEKVLPLIHPDVSNSSRVLHYDIDYSPRESVRRLVPEDVTNVGARDDLQYTPTLPNLSTTS